MCSNMPALYTVKILYIHFGETCLMYKVMQKSEVTNPLEYRFLVVTPFHEENNFPACVAIHRINLKDGGIIHFKYFSSHILSRIRQTEKSRCVFVPHCTPGCQLAGGCWHVEAVQHSRG